MEGKLVSIVRVAFVAAVLAPVLRADVLTVDDDGGAQFTDIQAAIDAAKSGDTILVADGSYGAFDVTKRLSILGRSDASAVQVLGRSQVKNVVSVRLAGIVLDQLELANIVGPAVLEDCEVRVLSSLAGTKGQLSVTGCTDVLLSRCLVSGRQGCCGDSPWPTGMMYGAGTAGLRIEESNVTVVDGFIHGGGGKSGCDWNTGASGIELRGGSLLVAGAYVNGGGGGAFQCLSYGGGDPGGDGTG